MATFIIVDSDKDPLGPDEIRAGDTIEVVDGDVFIISASADANIKFESASGNPSNFEIRFEVSNPNDFNVQIMDNLDAEIVISSGADLADVDISAKDSLSVIMTAGDNVSLGKFEGSEDGIDALTIGNGFTTDEDIKLEGGNNFLSIGDNATLRNIESKGGADNITIGDGLVAKDIKTGDGDDTLTIGDGATIEDIETKDGDDTIIIGNDLVAEDIDTEKGNDSITIGDNGLVEHIHTGDGDDSVTAGNDFTADHLATNDGDDIVTIGKGGLIDDLDGGKDTDTLLSPTDFPDADNFEIICFGRGTLIECEKGNVSIENLREGDRVRTLDNGLQPIRWIGSTRVAGRGVHAPVRSAAGALGNQRTLWVSQQHRMLLTGWAPELFFGEKEVLVPAKHLLGISGVRIVELSSVEYFHMLFEQHEIVFAEGIESESFHPGVASMNTLDDDARAEIFGLFPSLQRSAFAFGKSARLSLKSFEARILAA